MESSDFNRLAIFISGGGSNAVAILEYFKNHPTIKVMSIYSNNRNSNVQTIAEAHDLPFLIFDKKTFFSDDFILNLLRQQCVDYIVLAGFLWLVPRYLIAAYPDKILNIHPSLLPKFGGKGMYGIKVHESVFENKEKESGMTIHLVNEEFDKGRILFQESIAVGQFTTPEQIAKSVLKLEHTNYPIVIEDFILNQ